jgi:hypothetical protein
VQPSALARTDAAVLGELDVCSVMCDVIVVAAVQHFAPQEADSASQIRIQISFRLLCVQSDCTCVLLPIAVRQVVFLCTNAKVPDVRGGPAPSAAADSSSASSQQKQLRHAECTAGKHLLATEFTCSRGINKNLSTYSSLSANLNA